MKEMIGIRESLGFLLLLILVGCDAKEKEIAIISGPQSISSELRVRVVDAILEYDKSNTVNAERMVFEVYDTRSDLSPYFTEGDHAKSIGARFIVLGWEKPKIEEKLPKAPPRLFYVYVSKQNKVISILDEG